MEIQIRKSIPKDQPAIFEVIYKAWLEAYSHIYGKDYIINHFETRRNNPEYINAKIEEITLYKHHYVATINEKVVAVMFLDHITQDKDYAEILCFYVDPNYQRQGIGQKLYDFATNIAIDNNIFKINIEALKENPVGCAFYQKMGGHIISHRTRQFAGKEVECITFEYNLKRVELETDRLILRNYNESDLDDYFEYISHKSVGPRIGWEPYKTKEAAFERLKYEITKPFQFAIVLKSINKVIGSIELMPCKEERYADLNIEEDAKEIGFMLSPAFWGQGIMPEACKSVMKFAFEKLNTPCIYIGHAKANSQSEKVQNKLGFKVVGELKNYRNWIDGKPTSLIKRKMTKQDWLNQ